MFDVSPDFHRKAAPPIPSQALVAASVAVLGLWQILTTNGTTRHRLAGSMFVTAAAYVTLSGLFIPEVRSLGRSSPIHLLIPVTLAMLWIGVHGARAGRIKAHARREGRRLRARHRRQGALSLLPGRIKHETVFGAKVDG